MDSGMIGKIEKAIKYSREPERFVFEQLTVTVHGEHNDHVVHYDRGSWQCDCGFFASHHQCSHTIAIEKVLGQMLPGAIPSIMP